MIAPYSCMICADEGQLLCNRCSLDAFDTVPSRCFNCFSQTDSFATCSKCSPSTPLKRVWVASVYKDLTKKLVHKMKLNSCRQACSVVATRLEEIAPYYDKSVVITYVPTSTKRVRERGFDHARLIAKTFAKKRGLQTRNLLLRTTHQKQAGTDKKTRLQQAKGSYQAITPSISIDRVVLIDDIITTGATLSEATRVLKKAGVKNIESLVFAQPIG